MSWSWRVHAAAAAVLLPILLELMSFERLEKLIYSASSRPFDDAPDDATAARWVDAALFNKPWIWRRTCLRRATVLYYLLRRAGSAVDLCIGVRRDESKELKAHAWLLRKNELYVEPASTATLVDSYGVIARFPSAALPAR